MASAATAVSSAPLQLPAAALRRGGEPHEQPAALDPLSDAPSPPVNFVYLHVHNAIRDELVLLECGIKELQTLSAETTLLQKLSALKERYTFLERIYKYHSSVEDEVVYPALDAKVRNVTLAYSVEHEDEERLFEQLSQLLNTAVSQTSEQRARTIQQLECKVEEIHTTLRKHLAKEEEQLFPLLLRHFSYAEQASLVAQFLCTIPLASVETVLSWLKPKVPLREQEQLCRQVEAVVQDRLLRQLLVTWLAPASTATAPASSKLSLGAQLPLPDKEAGPLLPSLRRVADASISAETALSAAASCCRVRLGQSQSEGVEPCAIEQSRTAKAPIEAPDATAQEILHLHSAIRSALVAFADGARGLASDARGGRHLEALVERHRFLRAVCSCHSASEEEILLPAARRLCSDSEESALLSLQACAAEHNNEAAHFEELGRLLKEVKAFARRGAKEVAQLTTQLCSTADAVLGSMCEHMRREEAAVFPLLQQHLCVAEQRVMVWRTLRAMPLRLLERVMPWLAAKLAEADVEEMLATVRAAAPAADAALVQLLELWAARGHRPAARSSPHPDDPNLYDNQTCGPPQTPTVSDSKPPAKRMRYTGFELDAPTSAEQKEGDNGASTHPDGRPDPDRRTSANPIDHIFQFHKALRRDLYRLEADAARFSAAVQSASNVGDNAFAKMVQQLEGRFQFMWGLYRAHSLSEDEIVFPALEAKEALANVSHAYTLDHQQEEELLSSTHKVILALKDAKGVEPLRQLSSQLHRMSAALRASLEQHVQAEERELWPLFAENFTVEEQEKLVGVIIGRTGAEVMQSLLPWVTGSFTEEEQRGMMESLKSATRNTAFERWLASTMSGPLARGNSNGGPAAGSSSPIGDSTAGEPAPQPAAISADQPAGISEAAPCTVDQVPLESVAEYLASATPAAAMPGAEAPPPQSLSGTFRPGWEDIFRMNQKQLEAAARRIWGDIHLEPARKAYLMQHIMASRYIVAQQQQKSAAAPSADAPFAPDALCTYTKSGALGCKHYARAAAIVAPCCGRVFTCRHCHDESEDHLLDSKAVTTMLCMHCGTRQPVAGECTSCKQSLAAYFCGICRLWDDAPGRQIYHCPYCNLCRRGAGLGLDACHCMQCNCCMHLSEYPRHKCRDLSTCPVCTEYLFDSNQPYRELPCGHFMHSHCFGQYTRYNYTCPLCAKSLGDMAVYFQMIDALVAAAGPLPEEYAKRRQALLCNDCERRGEAPFHFVYHKCPHCASYNTRLV